MADLSSTSLPSNQSSSKTEKFSSFLEEITEKYSNEVGLGIGDGGIYLAHKSIFTNIQLEDMIAMNLSIINGKGTAEWKLMTPGTVIPQLPLHIHVNENDEHEYSVVRLSPWTVIVDGGEHLGHEKYETLLNYKKKHDDYLLQMSNVVKNKVRNNKFRSMCYGQSENIFTSPTALNKDTVNLIYKHAFPFISKDKRQDYVLYINGTHVMYLLYSMHCMDPENAKLLKHKLLMGPKTFSVEVDNQHLITGDDIKKMYMCPLFLGGQNIFLGNKTGENLFENTFMESIRNYNEMFNKHLAFSVDSCCEFPHDNFISGMFSSLTMEVIPTPFEIVSKATDNAKTLFNARLNFMATQMLRMKGLKAEEVTIQNSDKLAAMYIGAAIQLQISPTAFRCFREPLGKEQLGSNPIKSVWFPNEQSVISWNIKKQLEQVEEEKSESKLSEIVLKTAHDTTVFNFLAIADRNHILNCEMFLNNEEWAGWDKNRHKGNKYMPDLLKTVSQDKKKDAIRRRREKVFCEWMRKCSDIQYSELIFLRMNCNVFRFKSNVLYASLFILQNVELIQPSIKNGIEKCSVCEEKIFDVETNVFCPCYLFYAACCSITRPGKCHKVTHEEMKKIKASYNFPLSSEKYSDLASYKCTHSIPVVDHQGCLSGNGNIRLKHSLPDGFKTGRANTRSECNLTGVPWNDGMKMTDDPEQNAFAQTVQLSNIIKKVDDCLGPLFTDRYTSNPNCFQENAISSSNRLPMTTCEDINIGKLIEDELLKKGNISPFIISDQPIPSPTTIPDIGLQVKQLQGLYEMINNGREEEASNETGTFLLPGNKRKHFQDEDICNRDENLFAATSLPKVAKTDTDLEEECNKFVMSAAYSFLVNKKLENIATYESLKEEINVSQLFANHVEFLKKVQNIHGKQGGRKIAQQCCVLMSEIVENVCKTYFDILGCAMHKTFTSVASVLNMLPEQLDEEYEKISIYDNGTSSANKTKIKAKNVYDIHAPNSVMRKSTILSYIGHLRHQLDINVLNEGVFPESKAIDRAITALTQKHSIEAELCQLYITPALLNVVESSDDLPPTLTLLDPMKGIKVLNTPFISPAVSKMMAELTEPNYAKKINKCEEVDTANMSEIKNDVLGYVPCPLLNCDKMCHGISARKYDSVDGDDLLSSLHQDSVRFLNLLSDSFMQSQFHNRAVQYVITYLSKLNCYNHSSTRSILPPLITNVWQDIRRIICKVDALMEIPVRIYDVFAKRKKETKISNTDVNSDIMISVISNILKKDKISCGFFHLFCLMTELYGDSIGVSHTPQYNVLLERRSSWVRTLTRGFMRLNVTNGNPPKQLKWKSFKTFLVNTDTKVHKNALIATLRDIIPPHGYYISANMSYGGYSGVEASNTFRNLSFGDPFPSNSIYAFILDLTRNQNGKQIVVGRQSLYKNWTSTNNKKMDIDTMMHQLSMSSFVDEFNNKQINIHDLVDYYKRNQILPDTVSNDMKQDILLECLNAHVGMMQDDFERRLYTTSVFPYVWNVILGKEPSFVSDSDDDEEDDDEAES